MYVNLRVLKSDITFLYYEANVEEWSVGFICFYLELYLLIVLGISCSVEFLGFSCSV